MRPHSSPAWSKLCHVALYRQLAFEFRPWNEPSHQKRIELITNKPRRSWQRTGYIQLPSSTDCLMQVSIYAWALEHAVGSLLGLLDQDLMAMYFDLVQAENVPEGLESGWVSRRHIFAILEKFSEATHGTDLTRRSTHQRKNPLERRSSGTFIARV